MLILPGTNEIGCVDSLLMLWFLILSLLFLLPLFVHQFWLSLACHLSEKHHVTIDLCVRWIFTFESQQQSQHSQEEQCTMSLYKENKVLILFINVIYSSGLSVCQGASYI